ncbi:uncharacterized protein LOC121373612 [Gigantopelta aegis]|uniref:uncharacterized protein LOC121373612 n=1 Tax=Gigantopelta aegis TaxID=1735272 RepID=UPI001B88AD9F|nr:uncharacterized protein LOC121373612 [Gigantopelta aegis]XP_041356245.1 uncharacterized protein LOC121373612 [Gigantopelta aegis]
MDEKRLELDREERDRGCVTDGRHRRLYRRRTTRCDGRIWIFLILGFLMVVFGVIIGGMYLNIRALTESLQYTEVLPTYVTAVTVLASGFFIFLLFWKRLPCLVFVCVLVCVTTSLLCAVAAILTGTHVIQPIEAFIHCTYYDSLKECHCVSPYRRALLDLQHSPLNPANYVFHSTSNCNSIQTTLLHMLYALTVTYAAAFVTSVVSVILALLVLRMERIRRGVFEDDTYEEIFTVSNSSTPLTSDSDNDNNFCLPPFNDAILNDSSRLPESRSNASVIRRCRSFTQPRFFDTTEESIDDAHLPKVQPTAEVDSGNADGEVRSGGKLKENRRRHRRAVTLHNLDTRQLMMILSLHMRYLQENEAAKSQGHIDTQRVEEMEAKERIKRALTPQPAHQYRRYFSQDDSASQTRIVRSHTPQPYHERRSQSHDETSSPSYVIRSHTPQPYRPRNNRDDYNQQNYENTFDPAEFVQQLRQQKLASDVQNQQREASPPPPPPPPPHGREKLCHVPQIYENVLDTIDVSSQCGSESSECPVRRVSVKSKQKTKKQSGESLLSCKSLRAIQPLPMEISPNNYDEIDDLSSCTSETPNHQIYQNQDECEHLNRPMKSSASSCQPVKSSVSSHQPMTSSASCYQPMKSSVSSHRPIIKVDPPCVPPPPPVNEVDSSSLSFHQPIGKEDSKPRHRPINTADSSYSASRQPINTADPSYSASRQPINTADPLPLSSDLPITEVDPYAPYPNTRRHCKEELTGRPIQITNSSSGGCCFENNLSQRLKTASDHLHPIQTDIRGHLLDRCQTPSRPKSYINAVDQTLSARPVEGNTTHLEDSRRVPTDGQTEPLDSEGYLRMDINSRSPPVAIDIYAQPVKKARKNKKDKNRERPSNREEVVSQSDADTHSGELETRRGKKKPTFSGERSAFRAVCRHGTFEPIDDPYSVDQPIMTHHSSPQPMTLDCTRDVMCSYSIDQPMESSHSSNQPMGSSHSSSSKPRRLIGASHRHANETDYDSVYPVFEKSPQIAYAPPPYSPPPSYTDVFTGSRDGSQHSLLSASNTTTTTASGANSDSDSHQLDWANDGPGNGQLQEQFYENNPHMQKRAAAQTCPGKREHSHPVRSDCPAQPGFPTRPGFPVKLGQNYPSSPGENCPGENCARCDSGDLQFDESQYVVNLPPPPTARAGGLVGGKLHFTNGHLYCDQTTCSETADDSDADAMETVI